MVPDAPLPRAARVTSPGEGRVLLALSTLSALVLGALILAWSDPGLEPLFLVVGYLAVAGAIVASVRAWKDILNPLVLVLTLALLRFTLPFLSLAVREGQEVELFRLMGLRPEDWRFGHVLGLTGMLGVSFGWLLAGGRQGRASRLRLRLPQGALIPAVAGMVLGLFFLLTFVRSNASVEQVLVQGSFRATAVREGTGQYFYLSLMLIASSVILCMHLATRPRGNRMVALIPVLVAAAAYFVLGGRARAATPLVAGGLAIWYVRGDARGWHVPVQRLLRWTAVGLIMAVWAAYLGQLYRGGLGLDALAGSTSFSGVRRYAEEAALVEVGQLHSLAGAWSLGPVLEGRTFIGALTWPVSEILDIRGRSAGIFIVDTTIGVSRSRWGLLPSLVGEGYLNWGVPGLVMVTGVFGALLHVLYARFRAGRLQGALYVLAAVYALRIFVESVEKWGEAVVVFLFGLVLLQGSWLFASGGRGGGRRQRVAAVARTRPLRASVPDGSGGLR